MELQDIQTLKVGDMVKYVGETSKQMGVVFGELYEIGYIQPDRKQFTLKIGVRIGHNPFSKEWDISSYERAEVPLILDREGHNALIDLSLAMHNRELFHHFYNKAYPSN